MSLLALLQDAVNQAPVTAPLATVASGAPTFWEHHLSPDLIRIPFWKIGPIQDGLPIRYYSLAYLLGLALAWKALGALARRRLIGLTETMVADLVIPFALIGVMAGGRIGYLLFYDVDPTTHQYTWLDRPMKIFEIWEGGMASHGGVLGVLLAMVWFARSRRVPLLHLLDLCSLTAPIGLFLGRVANFINGELWGRATTVSWAVLFREAPATDPAFVAAHPELKSFFERGLCPRHPSQLYEALGEGLLIGLTLLAFRKKLQPKSGALTSLFLLGYGVARIVSEQFREPDAQIGYQWLGLTRGQMLTSVMLVGGIVLAFRSLRGKTQGWSVPPVETEPESESDPKPTATRGASR